MLVAPSFDASRDDEQKYFDDVYEIRESKRAKRKEQYNAAGDNKARARLKAESESDETLGKPTDAVAWLRVDTTSGEHFYVGNVTIAEYGDGLVYSWKAPLITKLRSATHDNPGDVVRHRRFQTHKVNEIREIDDVVLAELARRVEELDGDDVAVVETDEMLQEVLAAGRGTDMRQIVETIQAAQSVLIGSDPHQLLVVQGGPGTGKTAVALHRLSVILFNDRNLKVDDVLVVGPNRTFARYIERVLPQLGDEGVTVSDLDRLFGSRIAVSVREEPASARLKGDLRMVDIVRRGLRDRVRVPEDGLTFSVAGAPWRVTVAAPALQGAVDRLSGEPYTTGRQTYRNQLTNLVVAEIRAQMDADGERIRGDLATRVDGSEIDNAMERVWPRLSAPAFLRDLFGSLERLVSAAGSTLTADETQLLRRPASQRMADQPWSREDVVLVDEVEHQLGDSLATYSHIVVDEAQDLSPMQIRAVSRRSRNGAMTLVGDIAQSTGAWMRDSWADVLDLVDTTLPKGVQQLEFGYRVPRSVMELAAELLPIMAPGIVSPRAVREVEPGPRFVEVDDTDDLAARAVDLVREHSAKGLFVGVVVSDVLRGAVADRLTRQGIVWQDADTGSLGASINLMSPAAAKGLEFDAVVVVDPQGIVDAGAEGYRLLYVAMTRTTRYLDVVHDTGRLPAPYGSPAEASVEPVTPAGAAPVRVEPVTVGSVSMVETVAGEAAPTAAKATAPASSLSPRQQAVVDREVEEIVGRLEDTVPPKLWQAVLDEARQRLLGE